MSVAKAADEFSVCNVQAKDSELFCLDFRSFFVPVEITAVPVVVAFECLRSFFSVITACPECICICVICVPIEITSIRGFHNGGWVVQATPSYCHRCLDTEVRTTDV